MNQKLAKELAQAFLKIRAVITGPYFVDTDVLEIVDNALKKLGVEVPPETPIEQHIRS